MRQVSNSLLGNFKLCTTYKIVKNHSTNYCYSALSGVTTIVQKDILINKKQILRASSGSQLELHCYTHAKYFPLLTHPLNTPSQFGRKSFLLPVNATAALC